jgi:hypothetical protein
MVAVGCLLLGGTKLYWALGHRRDRPGRLDDRDRDLWWQLLTLSTGVLSLAGAWAILVLTARRGARRFLLPMTVGWVASGMLFAYHLFSRCAPMPRLARSPPLARVVATPAGIVLGLVMALIVLLVLHDRRPALRGASTDAE